MKKANLKKYLHNPPHLFLPGAKYWVTGSSYQHKPHFEKAPIKEKMLEILKTGCEKFGWQIDDW